MSKRAGAPQRHTVDLSSYPDLVVIYLGMYVKSPRGMKTLAGFIGPIRKSVEAGPDGLPRPPGCRR
jgi:hypothetical protein